MNTKRVIKAPTGTKLSAKSWLTEAPLRMLMNNLDPEVAERPEELIIYGGLGKAARNWECYDKIVETLKRLEEDETLLVQSGKPVGVFKTHSNAPRVLIANSNLVPYKATWETFNELDKKGLMMYGQMTAGSWIYIGSQGIIQGTYETFMAMAKKHFGGNLKGCWVLTGGLGGMGGAQPLAATIAGACMLAVECDESRIDKRMQSGYCDFKAYTLKSAIEMIKNAISVGKVISVGLLGNAAEVYPQILDSDLLFKRYLNKLDLVGKKQVMAVERFAEIRDKDPNANIHDFITNDIVKALYQPHSSLVEDVDLVWKLLQKSAQKDPYFMYLYAPQTFLNAFKNYDESYQNWIIKYIKSHSKIK
ncbi:MAG: hypothetical protein L3J44_00260 [Campylobacteraceae bacterium]|nr:hypothetical protein [Campylobacteraceae bacterium]